MGMVARAECFKAENEANNVAGNYHDFGYQLYLDQGVFGLSKWMKEFPCNNKPFENLVADEDAQAIYHGTRKKWRSRHRHWNLNTALLAVPPGILRPVYRRWLFGEGTARYHPRLTYRVVVNHIAECLLGAWDDAAILTKIEGFNCMGDMWGQVLHPDYYAEWCNIVHRNFRDISSQEERNLWDVASREERGQLFTEVIPAGAKPLRFVVQGDSERAVIGPRGRPLLITPTKSTERLEVIVSNNYGNGEARNFIICSPAVVGSVDDFTTLPPPGPTLMGAITAITGILGGNPRVRLQPSGTTPATTARMLPGSQIMAAAREKLASKHEQLLLDTAAQIREGEQELIALGKQLYRDHQETRATPELCVTSATTTENNLSTQGAAEGAAAAPSEATAQGNRSSSPLTPVYSPLPEDYVPLTYQEKHALRVGCWESISSGASGGSGGEESVFRALDALSDVAAQSGSSRPATPDLTGISDDDDKAYRIPPSHWKRREAVVCHETTTVMGTKQVIETVSARERATAALVYRAHQQFEEKQEAVAKDKEDEGAAGVPREPQTVVPEALNSLLRRFQAGELLLEDAPPAPDSAAMPACLSAEGTKGHRGEELCVGWAAVDAAEGACACCLSQALKRSKAYMLPTRVHDEMGSALERYSHNDVEDGFMVNGLKLHTAGRHTQAATSVLYSMRKMLDRLYNERRACNLPTMHLVKALEQSHKTLASVLEVATAACNGEDFQGLPMYLGMSQHMDTYDEKMVFLNKCDLKERERQQQRGGIEEESAKESDDEQDSITHKRESWGKRARSNVPSAVLFSDYSSDSEDDAEMGRASRRARRSASRD